MPSTVIEHVPGDYAFPVNDAIAQHPDIRRIGSRDELDAAYSADGYARIHGVGAVCTTYGVGELSAINGIAGAYAEHLPLFARSSTTLRATASWPLRAAASRS